MQNVISPQINKLLPKHGAFSTLQLTTERSEEPKLLPPKVLSLLSFQMDQTIAKGLSFRRIAPQLEKAQELQASNMPSYRPKSLTSITLSHFAVWKNR